MARCALALVMAVLVAGCSARGEESQKSNEPQVPVRIAALATRSFDDAIDAGGQWKSRAEVVVAAPFNGIVESLSARVGDQVAAGQAVGALSTLESHAALRGAQLLEHEARGSMARAEARRAVQLAAQDKVRVPITAPQAGVVVRRTAEPGTQVAEAAELIAIAPRKGIVFEAHVPPAQAPRIKLGDRARIDEEGSPARGATVERVLPAADPVDQTTLVWLASSGGGTPPQLGRFGHARVVVSAPHVAIAIPDSAVVEDDLTGEKRIAVVDSASRLKWTPVVLGAAGAGAHELRSPPLSAGTRIVVDGQRGLPDGTKLVPLR